MERPLDNGESLGAGLKPGDTHYRAYVGPPEDYDLIAAMTFNLLTTLGLRQHHSLLDVGCGSLRIGRLLIPYLNRGKYFGVEPNEWLVKEGIKQELGEALLQIKRPTFFFSDSPDTITQAKVSFDFALAQSIFSHCGLDLIKNWLSAISRSLAEDGALVATFLPGEEDSPTKGWVYPECVNYKPATMRQAAAEAGLRFEILDWKHPRQTWALFAAPKFDSTWLRNRPLTWNAATGKSAREKQSRKCSLRRHHRLPPIFRTRKATSTIRTGCGRFTIMNSWTIQLFERLTSAVFARHETITDGTGGFTSVCGPLPVPLDSKATSWSVE